MLQTLALIQRHADDQQAVSRLARSQERELRAWLYDPKVVREGGTWAGLVAGMVAEVEADHALIVDPVVVGDAPVDEALAALGAATREALVNAAKHSGATAADLYTEVTPERVSVFVRDRGKGFDPDDGARRPARAARLGERPADPAGRHGRGPVGAGGGDRGGAGAARGSARMSGPRVFVVDDHAMVRAGVRAELGDDVDVRRRGRRRRRPRSRASGRRRPTSSCSTCTCPAAAAGRCSRRCAPSCPTCGGWRCRCPTPPRTSSPSSGPAPAATSPRRSPGPTCSTPSAGWPTATSSSARGWPASCSTPSPPAAPAAPAPAEEATDPGLDLLSAREREVMQLLARGYTYREIGSRLFISVKTVESHASNVLRKLQLSNRNELTRWAATNRLL